MLYQVATGLLSADEIAGSLRSILMQRNVQVVLDDVVVDPGARLHACVDATYKPETPGS